MAARCSRDGCGYRPAVRVAEALGTVTRGARYLNGGRACDAPAGLSTPSSQYTGDFFRGALLMMSATVVSAGFGFVFWLLAARLLPEAAVGRDGALVATLIALAGAAQLNLAATLPRFLPQLREQAERVVLWAFGVSSLASLVLALGFVVIVPTLTDSLETAGDEPLLFVVFTAGVVLMTLMAVQDAALAGVRQARWLPIEQLLYNGLRVAVLALAVIADIHHAIMLAWVVPLLAVLPLSGRLLFARALSAHKTRPRQGETATPALSRVVLARFVAADSLAFLLRQAAIAAMPLLVLAYVGPAEAAAFTLPFALVLAFDMVFLGAATSLTVEGAQHGARLDALLDELIRRFLLPTLAVALVLALAAPLALLPFGSTYVSDGADALRFLALASAVRALLVLTEVLQRLRGLLRPVLAFSAIALVGVAVLGPLLIDAHGVTGGGAAWLLAHMLAAVAVAPIAIRTLKEMRGR